MIVVVWHVCQKSNFPFAAASSFSPQGRPGVVLTLLLVIERFRSSLACPWVVVYLYVHHAHDCFFDMGASVRVFSIASFWASCLINVDFELQVVCPVGACLVPRGTGYHAALVGGQPRDSQGVACWRVLLVIPAIQVVAVCKVLCFIFYASFMFVSGLAAAALQGFFFLVS